MRLRPSPAPLTATVLTVLAVLTVTVPTAPIVSSPAWADDCPEDDCDGCCPAPPPVAVVVGDGSAQIDQLDTILIRFVGSVRADLGENLPPCNSDSGEPSRPKLIAWGDFGGKEVRNRHWSLCFCNGQGWISISDTGFATACINPPGPVTNERGGGGS